MTTTGTTSGLKRAIDNPAALIERLQRLQLDAALKFGSGDKCDQCEIEMEGFGLCEVCKAGDGPSCECKIVQSGLLQSTGNGWHRDAHTNTVTERCPTYWNTLGWAVDQGARHLLVKRFGVNEPEAKRFLKAHKEDGRHRDASLWKCSRCSQIAVVHREKPIITDICTNCGGKQS